jgi:hypothetical protein
MVLFTRLTDLHTSFLRGCGNLFAETGGMHGDISESGVLRWDICTSLRGLSTLHFACVFILE